MNLPGKYLSNDYDIAVAIVLDQAGDIKYINSAACEMSGYNLAELVGQGYHLLVPGLNKVVDDLSATRPEGDFWRGELQFTTRGGEHILIDSSVITVLNDEGSCFLIVASQDNDHPDTTEGEIIRQNEEKEQLARELEIANRELSFQNDEREQRSRELAIANIELAFQIKEKDKRAAELLVANEELVFQNVEKEKRAEELIAVIEELKKAQARISELNEADILKLNEVLEQKVIDRTLQLEISNKELEAFSYSVSHDLRAPLRSINGYANILEEDYNHVLDDEGRRLLSIVRENAKKMGVLIDDLLAFSRLGKKAVHKTDLNMHQLARSAADDLNEISSSKATFKINDLEHIVADKSLMNQVWQNLISNAIKYSLKKEHPFIEINSVKTDDEVTYSITDNGVGFDMQYAHNLFGVFQRLHSEEEFEGTGVGLALVYRIISKHGGKIWATAEIDKGATFYFSLPKEIID